MILDLLILVVIALAVYVGFQRGLLPPLLSEAFFVLGLLLFLAGPLAPIPRLVTHIGAVHVLVAFALALVAGFLGGRLGRMLQRMPVVRGVDGFFGVFVHGLVALAALYVVLSALVAMDSAFDPLVKQATLTAAQVDNLRHALNSNPLTALITPRSETAQLVHDSHTKQGASLDNLPQLNQIQGIYLGFVRPQLYSSRLSPLVLRLGSRLPLVGRFGASHITRVQPTPSPTPTPTPTPNPKRKK